MAIQHFNQIELSRRWRLSPRTLERWRYRGTGPQFLKVGGRVIYRLEDIETFEAEQLRATGARQVAIRPSRCDRRERERGDHVAPASDPAAPSHGNRALRLDRAGGAGRGSRIPPRLSRARPHRLRPFRRAPARAALGMLGSRAHDLAERGLVHLVQLRHGPEDYGYFAIARPRRKGALPDFATLTITKEAA